jgi:2-acylglycerol O-acyltransferase 2
MTRKEETSPIAEQQQQQQQQQPQPPTIIERIVGGINLLIFVLVWLLSAISPFLFLYSIMYKQFWSLTIILLITRVAHSPGIVPKPTNSNTSSNRLRKFFGHYTPKYFRSVRIIWEGQEREDVDNKQTLYGVHPHGVFCMGWAKLFLNDDGRFDNRVRFCFAPYLYQTPFFRLFALLLGKPGSASKQDMISYLRNGESVALPPGGFEEATITSLDHDRVYIRRRTGFIKLCLQHGVALRPVYVFGEKDCYYNMQGLWKLRLLLNRYGLPTIFPWGCLWMPLLPKLNAQLYIVIGEPIAVPKINDPTKEDIRIWHDKYINSLIKIYETHKERAYYRDKNRNEDCDNIKTMKLEIW